MTHTRLASLAIVCAFASIPMWAVHLQPNAYKGGQSRNVDAAFERNRSAMGTIIGELRTSASDMMFIKTERYFHGGVGYKPHREKAEVEAAYHPGGVEDHEPDPGDDGAAHDGADHDEPSKLIRASGEDFRGFIGNLERQVKPFSDEHFLADGKEMLPWYRMITITDPHNIRAYQLGAWWLRQQGETGAVEGMKFIDEGLRHNPDAFQLFLMRGYLLKDQLDTPREALAEFEKAADLAYAQRPEDPEANLDWNAYAEDDALAAFRMAIVWEDRYGDKHKALDYAERFVLAVPDDGPMKKQRRLLREALGIQPPRNPAPAAAAPAISPDLSEKSD